ncbi:MAG: hypothetical protein HY815_15520 [Candidatus Riflebacteria bacterium]|nr:hypothetical protein [Candidatus Riflebacteria bacterium]
MNAEQIIFSGDLRFNVIAGVVDLATMGLAVHLQRRGVRNRRVWLALSPLFAVHGIVALLIALDLRLRIFAVLRWVGMALFWHVPPLLLALAWLFRSDRRESRKISVLAAVLVLVHIWAYWIEPFWLEVTRYELTHPRLAGLTRPVVVAQVSDIQVDSVGEYERRAISTLAGLKPDLVLYTGDFAQVESEQEYARLLALLGDLIDKAGPRPPLGSYAVCGDVDLTDPGDRRTDGTWAAAMVAAGITPLRDSTVILSLPGCAVNLIALDVVTSRATLPAHLRAAARGRDERLFDLVIGHSPDYAEVLSQLGRPFLALAGHTHGGQVQIPGVGPLVTLSRLPRRFADGFLPFGPGTLSTSRGIGVERYDAPRLRLFCRPELRLVTLRPPPRR